MNRRRSKSVVVNSLTSSFSSAEDDSSPVVVGEKDSSSSHGETDVDDEVSSYGPSEDDDSEVSATDESDSGDSDDGPPAEQETRSNGDVSSKRGQDDDSLYNIVIKFLQAEGEREVKKVTLNALRVYLRRHGLRITGTKDVCLARIEEHWRIKDEKAESLYPRSSFTINCKGDVCKGDVILFTQKVYKSRGRETSRRDKVKRSKEDQRTRTVAGRVIKESYGAAKQQHTFTVEVFWSEGANKLPALFPLLVKGRNLYRIQTFRQPWKDEAVRKQVLDEKHKRGALARQTRDMRLGRADARKKTNSLNCAGQSSQNWMSCAEQLNNLHLDNHQRPPKQPTTQDVRVDSKQSTSRNGNGANYAHVVRPPHQSGNSSRSTSCPPRNRQWNAMLCAEQSSRHQHHNDRYRVNGQGNKFQNNYWSNGQFYRGQNVWVRTEQSAQYHQLHYAEHHHVPNDHRWGNGNAVMFQDRHSRPARPFADASSHQQQFYSRQSNYTSNTHASRPASINRGYDGAAYFHDFHGSPPPPPNITTFGRGYDQESRIGSRKCSRNGCVELRTDGCASYGCWRCCRRSGTRCRVHH